MPDKTEQKLARKLPSFKVKPNETFTVFIAVDITSVPGVLIPKLSLTQEQAKDEEHFVKISATFTRWNWAMKSFIQQQSEEIKTESGIPLRSLNKQKYNEYKLRYLLNEWTVPEDTGEPMKIEREDIDGRVQLSNKTFGNVVTVNVAILEAVLSQLDNVLEYGVQPEALAKAILEGEDRGDFRPDLERFLTSCGLSKAKAEDCLKVLNEGPLKTLFPKKEAQLGNAAPKPPSP